MIDDGTGTVEPLPGMTPPMTGDHDMTGTYGSYGDVTGMEGTGDVTGMEGTGDVTGMEEPYGGPPIMGGDDHTHDHYGDDHTHDHYGHDHTHDHYGDDHTHDELDHTHDDYSS